MSNAVGRLVAVQVRRRWRMLVLVGLVAGLVGGVAVSSFAGARRTSTAYDRLVETSEFPDVLVQLVEPRLGLAADIGSLPSVERSVEASFVVGRHRGQRSQLLLPVQTAPTPIADFVLVRGRAAHPSAVDEAVISENVARAVGLDVGDVFPYQALTGMEFADLLRDRWAGTATGLNVDLHIVGITRSPTDPILGEFPTLVGTPALGERLASDAPGSAGVWIHLRDGADPSTLVSEIETLRGPEDRDRLNSVEVTDFGEQRGALDDAVSVLVVGMVVFGSIVVIAGVVVVAQMVSRITEQDDDERRVLRDLGLGSRSRLSAAVLPGIVSVAVAVCTSAALAVALSRFTPVGVARNVEPSAGTESNLAFLAVGALVVALVTLGVWTIAALRRSSRGTGSYRSPVRAGSLRARLGAIGSGPGLPVATMFVLGEGHRSSSRRLSVLGVTIGVAGVVASSLFGASLDRLASDPDRWGWVGDHVVEVPEPVRDDTYAALDDAAEVDAYAEVQGGTVTVEGRSVDAYRFSVRRGTMAPVLLQGRAPDSPGEVALGPALLEDLGIGVGDLVDVDDDRLRVVGSVLTFGLADRSTNVEGAMVDRLAEAEYTSALVRFAPGVEPDRAGDAIYGDLEYGPPVRPAQVTNLAALRALPLLLTLVLAVVGIAAAIHTALWLAARSRRDLAVLRALGLQRRHARRIVTAACATVVVTSGALGVVLGSVVAKVAWTVVAGSTGLATDLRLPALLYLVAPAVVGIASLVGSWSGRRSVRSLVARTLRTE